MWDFSGDEFLFLFAAIAASLIGLGTWYAPLVVGRAPFRWSTGRTTLALAPLAPLVVIFVILNTLADPQFVVGHPDYIFLFLLGGVFWTLLGTRAFVWTGLEMPVGLLERRNLAALITLVGAMSGVGLVYAGSNIGGGPTIWTTLVPALVATATLVLLAGLLELLTDTADAITIDRDVATGLRTAALLVANGVMLGRAMAGDWSNWPETFTTFARLAWPAVALTLAVAVANRQMRPTPQRPEPAAYLLGVVPAVAVLALAAAYVVSLGWPEVAPAPPPPSSVTPPPADITGVER